MALGGNVEVQCRPNHKINRWVATDFLKRKEAEVTRNTEIDSESQASTSQIPHKETKKRRVKRKYYESYLAFGFSYTGQCRVFGYPVGSW